MCQMAADMELPLHDASSNPLQSSSLGDEAVEVRQDSRGEKTEDLPPSPATPISKGTCKKKRLNKAAKLRQCKMDARRGQWLAQVAGKLNKSESCASSQDDTAATEMRSIPTAGDVDVEDGGLSLGGRNGSFEEPRLEARQQGWVTLNVASKNEQENSVQSELMLSDLRRDLEAQHFSTLEGRNQDSSRSRHQSRDLEVQQFPTLEGRKLDRSPHQSPGTSNVGYQKPREHVNEVQEQAREESSITRIRMHGFSTSSSSEASTSRSNSSRASSRSDESGSDEDDGSEVDDWEAAADALHVQASLQEAGPSKIENRSPDRYEPLQNKSTVMASSDMENCLLKPESKYRSGTFGARMRADLGRAWRPDDVSRPPTLPRLSKQHSFPIQSSTSVWSALHGNIWGPPPAPSHCPICTEELDTTDSSFIPCSCGFRLCLFCHHKIVLGDGRCPGCRKSYNSEVALKLSRTCSVRPRS